MTITELSINIIVIILLIPAIYYAVKLNHQLIKLEQNQQKMTELAQALKYAVDNLDKPETVNTPQPTISETELSSNTCCSESGKDSPSEAELELLQALRSIK